MMAEISEVYSGLSDDVRPEDLVVGTPLCALFAEDGEWYRAVIEGIPSEFEVRVRYIDYGNSDVVLLSDVRQLSKRFYDLPVQAVHCCLDFQLDLESLHQRVDDKELKATFLSLENGTWKVSLSDGVERMPEDTAQIVKINEYLQPGILPEMKDRVYVCHVVSPDEFYVQFESALNDLSLLSGQISQFYTQLAPSAYVLNDPCPGMSCCARFSQDGDWYRGKIKDVISPGANVQFIDYGNEELVPFHFIKDPDKKFMQLPQQAILCGLDATKDIWSAQEINIFKTVALDKSFEARFIIRDGKRWRVCLESTGVSIVDMFLTKDATSQQAEREVSTMQTRSYTQQELLSGQIEEVFVSHVTESGDFYIQLSKTLPDLGTLEILVSETYDQLGPTKEAVEMCFVDSLCCAKFSQDFKWYRALVTKVFSDTEVEVLFVDYGNTDTVKVETVKQVKPALLAFPVQAVKCRLEGSKEVWSESDVEQFEASVIDKPLHVTFTRQEGDTWFVTIQELDMFASKTTPKVKSFSKEVFDCNKRENAYFVYADSPDCIWLQPERTGDALLELMDQIANDITGQTMDKSQVHPGVPCLGQFTDNDVWHRAQILAVQGSTSATVFYVDYGNSETLPVDRLQPISDAHLKLPAQAIHCHMADVQGVEPSNVTNYLNEVLLDKVLGVEVENQHPDGSYTVKVYEAGAEQSVNKELVCECLGDTSLLEETTFEQATPPRLGAAQEKRAFWLPKLEPGSKLPVSFVSAFLPVEMQLLLTERIEERNQLSNRMTSLYESLGESELELENLEVGVLCCVHFTSEQEETKKWCRGEIISISADETATVKLVDYGTHEKIPITKLKCLKDELLQIPVFVMECSLANVFPSSDDGQWSQECLIVLESMCQSKTLVAEITQFSGDLVELVLYDESGKSVNQKLVDLGFAKASDIQEDLSRELPSFKWPELQVGQCIEVYLMAVKDLKSIQVQFADSEADLTKMREQLTSVYSTLGEAEEVFGNPRVGQTCCAQFADDGEWYRAVVTCVSDAGVEVKFVDYGNMDVALTIKELKEEFYVLPVQCFECSLNGVAQASDISEAEVAAKLLELCDGKQLTAEVTSVSGDSVVVNLLDVSGETKESVGDILIKLGHAVCQPTPQEVPRRVSVSEEGKVVYKYPEPGDILSVSLISVNSPSDFCCQLQQDSTSELMSLSEKIELFYQSLGENDLRLLCLQAGDICCAKFTDDDKWYRSQVNKVCSDGQVCVRSVDYSKQETLTLNRIKKLEAEFTISPVGTINCSLSNIEPPHKYYGEEWSSEAVGRFKELCEGKDLKIKVKETHGNLTHVQLLDSEGLSLANQLLAEGLAVETKPPLTLSPLKQVETGLEQSSEEEVFQEAEGVDELAKEEDNEAEEEEFHDSSDQISDDTNEKREILVNLGDEEKGVSQTIESSLEGKEQAMEDTGVQGDGIEKEGGESSLERKDQAMEGTGVQGDGIEKEGGESSVERKDQDLEDTGVQEDGMKAEGGESGQIVEDAVEEKPSPETEEQQEDGHRKEEDKALKKLDSEIGHGEENENMKEQSIERGDVLKNVHCEVEEGAEVANSVKIAEGSEKTGEESKQELKTEESLVTDVEPERKKEGEEREADVLISSETVREEPEETKVVEDSASPNVAKEKDGDIEKETNEGGSSEDATETKEESHVEGSATTYMLEQKGEEKERETNNVDSCETAVGGAEESKTEESPLAAADFEEMGDSAEKQINERDSVEEQEEPEMEEVSVTAADSERKGESTEKETDQADSCEIAREGREESLITASVSEQKEESLVTASAPEQIEENFVTASVSEQKEENLVTASVSEQKEESLVTASAPEQIEENFVTASVPEQKEENLVTASVSEQKEEEEVEEQSNELPEDQEHVTEAFSEEELTGRPPGNVLASSKQSHNGKLVE